LLLLNACLTLQSFFAHLLPLPGDCRRLMLQMQPQLASASLGSSSATTTRSQTSHSSTQAAAAAAAVQQTAAVNCKLQQQQTAAVLQMQTNHRMV
jgi:hypothetical protein